MESARWRKMATRISKSPEETLALGREFGELLEGGMLVGLVGDLGSGKTVFVKGLAEGLGIAERVHSPTFSLVNEYVGGRLPCFHLDLYRLESRAQIQGAGLEELMDAREGVVVVEWYDRFADLRLPAPPKCCVIRFETLGDMERALHYEHSGD